MQPPQRIAEPRTEAQETGAFTFWFRRPHAVKHVGAWMLKQNANEGAFLTAVRHAPRIGERLELSEPDDAASTVPEQIADRGLELPKFGRVVRLDKPQGATRRVAIQFEEPTCARPF